MADSPLEFYENFADDYHLIGIDWDSRVREQGQLLTRLLRGYGLVQDTAVLDCSCGIGTQAIGLALEGLRVTATDISPSSLQRAEREAKRFGVSIDFAVADFRTLAKDLNGRFSAIISCDNAITHLHSEDEMSKAAQNMRTLLEPNGSVVISTRDYDRLRLEKATGHPAQRIRDSYGERIYFQTWDWDSQGQSYNFELFILRKVANEWKTSTYTCSFRAWLRSELKAIFLQSGFNEVQWRMPEETGYFQPLMVAR